MIEKPKSVRAAEPKDEEAVFGMLMYDLYKENGIYKPSTRKIYRMIEMATRDKETIIGVIDAPDGNGLAGSIGASFAQWWHSDEWHIEEYWNYVNPAYRHSHYAKDLINYIKWISEQMSMPAHIGVVTDKRMAAKIRFYQGLLPQVGAFFAHNLDAKRPVANGDV